VTRVPRELALPLLAGAVLSIVCLITFPWETLLVGAVAYVSMIPVSALQYLRYKRQAETKPE
jgi:Flp pilus assembly protein TadB